MDYTQHVRSPLGGITLASDGEALTGLWFDGQKYFAVGLAEEHEERELPIFAEAERWLDVYFGGKDPGFTPKLHLKGTDFRKRVWAVLLTIPFGQTVTYGQLAARLPVGSSPRAVGGAVGHNPISLIIPCHRVVGADGRLTGYAGGGEKKRRLLALEQMTTQR